ncbi:hypothetical protein TWF696_004893 [Orbilia brochopaga]|uniref:F-box domain-containing protein n=1 Tax=Orbilia brochopaga TaxID=3140254 RepID=A0AAV9V1U1_9PEZI
MSLPPLLLPELLADILLHLSAAEILRLRRVCRTWNFVVDENPRLRLYTSTGFHPNHMDSYFRGLYVGQPFTPLARVIISRMWDKVLPFIGPQGRTELIKRIRTDKALVKKTIELGLATHPRFEGQFPPTKRQLASMVAFGPWGFYAVLLAHIFYQFLPVCRRTILFYHNQCNIYGFSRGATPRCGLVTELFQMLTPLGRERSCTVHLLASLLRIVSSYRPGDPCNEYGMKLIRHRDLIHVYHLDDECVDLSAKPHRMIMLQWQQKSPREEPYRESIYQKIQLSKETLEKSDFMKEGRASRFFPMKYQPGKHWGRRLMDIPGNISLSLSLSDYRLKTHASPERRPKSRIFDKIGLKKSSSKVSRDGLGNRDRLTIAAPTATTSDQTITKAKL